MPVAWCLASPKIGERERTAQRPLAMAAASWHNRAIGAPERLGDLPRKDGAVPRPSHQPGWLVRFLVRFAT